MKKILFIFNILLLYSCTGMPSNYLNDPFLEIGNRKFKYVETNEFITDIKKELQMNFEERDLSESIKEKFSIFWLDSGIPMLITQKGEIVEFFDNTSVGKNISMFLNTEIDGKILNGKEKHLLVLAKFNKGERRLNLNIFPLTNKFYLVSMQDNS